MQASSAWRRYCPRHWLCVLPAPGRSAVGSKGVVRDPAVHALVCDKVRIWWSGIPDWHVLGIEPSPIAGAEGNREFLMAALKKA